MTATQVRRHASTYGFKLVIDQEGKLFARGNPKAMTPELKGLIDAHKPAIIESIKSEVKLESDSATDVIRWFFGFVVANVGGFRERNGEIVDVQKRTKELQDTAAKMGAMPSEYAADETAFRAAEKTWIDQVREFREVFEDGEIWKENP